MKTEHAALHEREGKGNILGTILIYFHHKKWSSNLESCVHPDLHAGKINQEARPRVISRHYPTKLAWGSWLRWICANRSSYGLSYALVWVTCLDYIHCEWVAWFLPLHCYLHLEDGCTSKTRDEPGSLGHLNLSNLIRKRAEHQKIWYWKDRYWN